MTKSFYRFEKLNMGIKRWLFLFIFMLITVFLPQQVFADASGTDGACKWTWVESSKTLTVTGGNMTERSAYSDYPWANYVENATKIVCNTNNVAANAFYYAYRVSTIDLGTNVNNVGDYAFRYAGSSTYVNNTVNLYLRRNANMTFGTKPFYNFSSTDNVHLWPVNFEGTGTAPYNSTSPN